MINQNNAVRQKESLSYRISDLTNRELEIINLVISGKCSREIADTLYISDHTVKTHRKNINKKLDIANPVQLTLLAKKEGLLSD
jgi:DNA-binding NarL/FixJ family response regulator